MFSLCMYVLKQKTKKVRGFHKKKSRIFKLLKKFTKIKTFKHNFLKFLSFVNLGRKDVNLGRKDENLGRKNINIGMKFKPWEKGCKPWEEGCKPWKERYKHWQEGSKP